MIRAHTVEQVRAAEAALMATLPPGTLMQRAAAGLAHAVLDLLGGGHGRRVLLVVGAGDNGGDALWAGVRLAGRGARVEALLVADTCHDEGRAALLAAGGLVTSDLSDVHPDPDVVVDGVVGIGGRPGLRARAVAAFDAFPGVPVVAVDVASGVDVDSGELDGPHVSADLTVTFGTHKAAHLVDPAALSAGAVHLVDIGLELPPPAVAALQPADVAAMVPVPAATDQKYTRGVVGVRAGSATYPGAGLLAVAGASCGLAGMVRFVGPPEVTALVRRAHPEVVGDGRAQAWVVGPGGGEDAGEMLAWARGIGVPLVVDADALRHVTGRMPACVLTPHAGELAEMTGADRADVEAAPLDHARRAAERFDCVVLLKGRRTLVAEPGGLVHVSTTGTPWLATAGAGDVLAGLIGSLMGAGLGTFVAASAGAWIHGAAATRASAGGPLTAGAVAREIPLLLREVLGGVGQSQP